MPADILLCNHTVHHHCVLLCMSSIVCINPGKGLHRMQGELLANRNPQSAARGFRFVEGGEKCMMHATHTDYHSAYIASMRGMYTTCLSLFLSLSCNIHICFRRNTLNRRHQSLQAKGLCAAPRDILLSTSVVFGVMAIWQMDKWCAGGHTASASALRHGAITLEHGDALYEWKFCKLRERNTISPNNTTLHAEIVGVCVLP